MSVVLTPITTVDLVSNQRVIENPTLATVDSTWIAALVTAQSDLIRRFCHRDFNQTDYSEYYDGGSPGYGAILLRQFPVIAISRVAASPNSVMTVQNTSTSVQRSTIATTSTGLTLTRVVNGTSTSNSLTYASYATVTLLAAAINAVGNGWTATVQGSYGSWPSADIKTLQGAYPTTTSAADLIMYTEEYTPYQYELTASSGLMRGPFPWGSQSVWVQYTAGFASVPSVVQEACVQAVLEAYQANKRNVTLQAVKLGPYQKTYADAQKHGLSANVQQMLSSYVAHDRVIGPPDSAMQVRGSTWGFWGGY